MVLMTPPSPCDGDTSPSRTPRRGGTLNSVPPARVDLVELADERGEFEVAEAARFPLREGVHVGARLGRQIIAQDVERAGAAGIDLDLAGAFQAIEPDERLGDGAARRQDA